VFVAQRALVRLSIGTSYENLGGKVGVNLTQVVGLPECRPKPYLQTGSPGLVVIFGTKAASLTCLQWNHLHERHGIQRDSNLENIHRSRGKQGNNRQGNQGLDHHADLCPARQSRRIRR